MNIDFHHAVTYVAARLAGFESTEASVIAWSAQYVDDATESGHIAFDNKGMYCHIASAHKMLDYRNLDALANHRAWIPFHFLPGNEGLAANQGHIEFTRRVICRPNSFVARDMVERCIRDKDHTPYGLHRLGITLHVYADTWAHQGFSGISHDLNKVHDLRDAADEPYRKMIRRINDFYSPWSRIKNALKEWFGFDPEASATKLINDFNPLGHGAALSMPDKPYLIWRYRNDEGIEVLRDNPRDFLEAAEAMCQVMQRYLGKEPVGLPEHDRQMIDRLLRTIDDEDRYQRHRQWLAHISDGAFSFGKVDTLRYVETGWGSWKDNALGVGFGDGEEIYYTFTPSFLASHWKLFHDALQAHRIFILNDLLPRYGICAA